MSSFQEITPTLSSKNHNIHVPELEEEKAPLVESASLRGPAPSTERLITLDLPKSVYQSHR